ncbi:MAG: antitoxin family protein [Candidatus Caldarchaeum sp.]
MREILVLEAIYEDGVIKPLEKLDLPEHTHLHIEVTPLLQQPTSLRGLWKGCGDLSDADFKAAKRIWEHELEQQFQILKGASQ